MSSIAETVAAVIAALASADIDDLPDADRIDELTALEQLKAAAFARQVRVTDAFARSQRARLLAAGRPDIKNDVAQLRALGATLNKPANTAAYEKFITGSPEKIAAITRTATYGSWFNFYLCRFDAKNIVLPTGPTPAGLGYNVASARCR